MSLAIAEILRGLSRGKGSDSDAEATGRVGAGFVSAKGGQYQQDEFSEIKLMT